MSSVSTTYNIKMQLIQYVLSSKEIALGYKNLKCVFFNTFLLDARVTFIK